MAQGWESIRKEILGEAKALGAFPEELAGNPSVPADFAVKERLDQIKRAEANPQNYMQGFAERLRHAVRLRLRRDEAERQYREAPRDTPQEVLRRLKASMNRLYEQAREADQTLDPEYQAEHKVID